MTNTRPVTQDFCVSQKYQLPGGGTDYAFARPAIPGVVQPDRLIYWGGIVAAEHADALQRFMLPDGTLDFPRLNEAVKADYDSRVVEFFRRWEVQHAQDKNLSNNFEGCRRTLGNMAGLQGWYGKYQVRSDIARSSLYDVESVTDMAKRLKLVEANRSQT